MGRDTIQYKLVVFFVETSEKPAYILTFILKMEEAVSFQRLVTIYQITCHITK
jgi:hypothetical protein